MREGDREDRWPTTKRDTQVSKNGSWKFLFLFRQLHATVDRKSGRTVVVVCASFREERRGEKVKATERTACHHEEHRDRSRRTFTGSLLLHSSVSVAVKLTVERSLECLC